MLLTVGASASETPGCDAFRVYFNNGDDSRNVDFCTLDVAPWLIAPSNLTATGRSSCLPGANYSQWQQGVWPYINSAGAAVAGGVPQAANLSLHLDTIRATLRFWVPGAAAYAGNAVIDMEYWRPDFATLAPPYRNPPSRLRARRTRSGTRAAWRRRRRPRLRPPRSTFWRPRCAPTRS